jgi:hypothetical protein
VLQNLTVGASDPSGNPINTLGEAGTVTVLGPTPTAGAGTSTPTHTVTATATATASPTPEVTNTPSQVPSDTPTQTPTVTFTVIVPSATPTDTATDTATATPTPTATQTFTHTHTPTLTATPAPPQIDVGTISGAAGSTVLVPVSLVSKDAELSAVSNEIAYDPSLVAVVLVNGTPDCAVDQRLAGQKRVFAKVAEGDGGMQLLRVGLIGTDNNSVLADGPLYACRFVIDVNTATGSIPLGNAPDGSDPQGEPVTAEGAEGAIEVTGAPPALDLEQVTAGAGQTVAVRATLNGRGRELSAVAMDVAFDSSLVQVSVDGQGNPDCAIGAAIGAGTAADKELVARVLDPDQTDADILRVGIIGKGNNELIPDGVAFSCNFRVAADAATGSVPLGNLPDASDAEGNPVGLIGDDGAIDVTGPPPALDLERVTASAGGTVAVQGLLRSRGQEISAVAADITYDPTLVQALVDGEGNPDCIVDDAIGPGTGPDKRLFTSFVTLEGAESETLRVGIIATDNNEPLTDGAAFTCNFRVADDAPAAAILLGNAPDASSPEGTQFGLAGENGAITVE